jgi:hypothetical protein
MTLADSAACGCTPDALDLILRLLSRCADPIVAVWAWALLSRADEYRPAAPQTATVAKADSDCRLLPRLKH